MLLPVVSFPLPRPPEKDELKAPPPRFIPKMAGWARGRRAYAGEWTSLGPRPPLLDLGNAQSHRPKPFLMAGLLHSQGLTLPFVYKSKAPATLFLRWRSRSKQQQIGCPVRAGFLARRHSSRLRPRPVLPRSLARWLLARWTSLSSNSSVGSVVGAGCSVSQARPPALGGLRGS